MKNQREQAPALPIHTEVSFAVGELDREALEETAAIAGVGFDDRTSDDELRALVIENACNHGGVEIIGANKQTLRTIGHVASDTGKVVETPTPLRLAEYIDGFDGADLIPAPENLFDNLQSTEEELPSDFSQAVRLLSRPYLEISQDDLAKIEALTQGCGDVVMLGGVKATWGNCDGGKFALMPLTESLNQQRAELKASRKLVPASTIIEVVVPANAAEFASEPTFTSKMRVARIEQAIKAWHTADETADDFQAGEVSEHAAIMMLADLRHYCDAHGLDFAQLDRHAYADYVDQVNNDRHHQATPASI